MKRILKSYLINKNKHIFINKYIIYNKFCNIILLFHIYLFIFSLLPVKHKFNKHCMLSIFKRRQNK